MAFKPRTFGPASIAASSLAETIWADEVRDSAWFPFNFSTSMAPTISRRRDAVDLAVSVVPRRASRPSCSPSPPDAEGESAVSLLLSELDNASALSLLRSLLARSDAVRDLALRLEGGQLFSNLLTKL